ncbi:hypothetical protein SCLCIDRAFT_439406 [Scleroderma citrinum Foug A]|uniref:Uncharacterized protein n=1 Tax=Scleroderma citrinum Foug A TaxID=1036808 RepID=A0A0C2YUN5_9AGAM|nr:hypothetical protein SCLCIDRAFT_439406 [Scleroderma citrinum Foug A]
MQCYRRQPVACVTDGSGAQRPLSTCGWWDCRHRDRRCKWRCWLLASSSWGAGGHCHCCASRGRWLSTLSSVATHCCHPRGGDVGSHCHGLHGWLTGHPLSCSYFVNCGSVEVMVVSVIIGVATFPGPSVPGDVWMVA